MEKKIEEILRKLDPTNPEQNLKLPHKLLEFVPENLDSITEVIRERLKASGESYFVTRLDLDDGWGYLVKKIGRMKFEEAMNVVDTWLEKEPTLEKKIPCVVLKLSMHIADKTRVLPFLERWIMHGKICLDVALNALNMIL